MSKLALGTVQFGLEYGVSSDHGQVRSEELKRILSYALSNNIKILDTAPSYGNCEEVLGKNRIFNFKIVTKTRHFNKASISSDDTKFLKKDFFNSLEKLKKESVYALLIHNAEDLLKPNSEKILKTLEELKKSKKIVKIGVSVYDLEQLESILNNFEIDIVQLPFNILDKRMIDSGMLKSLYNNGIEVHARSVFLQGLLLMSIKNRPKKFNHWNNLWQIWHQWLNDNQITPLEASLKYAISIPEISKVLVGVQSKSELEEIVIASTSSVDLPDIPSELYTSDAKLLNPSMWSSL